MRLVWLQLRDYPTVANYRSLITINQLHEKLGSRCPVVELADHEIGLLDFVQAKELSLQPAYLWFHALGLERYYRLACQHESFDSQYMLRVNQWLFVATVMVGALLMRLLTGSWILSMIAAATLLSRGRLVSSSGDLNWNTPLAFFVTLWTTLCIHFFRTGSKISLGINMALVFVASLFDPSMAFLSFALPLLLAWGFIFRKVLTEPVLQRLRLEKKRLRAKIQKGKLKAYSKVTYPAAMFDVVQKILGRGDSSEWLTDRRKEFERGGLFEVIRIPFALWANYNHRWLKIALFWLVFGCLNLLFLGVYDYLRLGQVLVDVWHSADFSLGGLHWLIVKTWLRAVIEPLDLHFSASILVIVLCALQSPAEGLVSFFETAWLILFSIVVLFFGAALLDYADALVLNTIEGSIGAWTVYAWARAPDLLIWFEPVILIVGIAGIFNLFKVARGYLPEQASRRKS